MFNRMVEHDRKYCEETQQLFAEIADGKFEAYTSVYVLEELAQAPAEKRDQMLELIQKYDLTVLERSPVITQLADEYAARGILSEKHSYDRLHIACASVNAMNMIISLNFTHINRPRTKTLTDAVNRMQGYHGIYIGSPMEVIENDDSF